MDYNEFKTALKTRIKRTEPDRSGSRLRYLDENEPELDEFVVQKCYAYLRASEKERRQLEGLLDDDDCLWFFQEFIHRQCSQAALGDREALLLGLTTIAIIGPGSDPRDVTFWVGDCYEAAKKGAISDANKLFKTVAAIEVPTDSSGQWRWQYVANQITRGFEDGERWDARQRKKRPRDVPAAPAWPPLIEAAIRNDIGQIIDLLRQGADINAGKEGVTALAMAVFALKERAVEILLEAGAPVDVKPNGMSLLEWARLADPYGKANVRVIQILKQHGAS